MGNDPSIQPIEYKSTLLHEPTTTATIEWEVSWRGDKLVIGGKDYTLLKSLQQEACKLNESFNFVLVLSPIYT